MIGAQITREAAVVFLTGLLVCAPSLAQGQAQQVTATIPSSQTANARALKAFAPDPKRARKAIEAGEKAEAELRIALHIDPTNGTVHERITQMESMKNDDPLPARPEPPEGLPQVRV